MIGLEGVAGLVALPRIVKGDCRLAGAIVGGVLVLNLVEPFARDGIGDLAVRGGQPGFEGRLARLQLGQPGAVAGQQVLGDESLLILEGAHRGRVVDQRELLRDRDARHRGRVLQRR